MTNSKKGQTNKKPVSPKPQEKAAETPEVTAPETAEASESAEETTPVEQAPETEKVTEPEPAQKEAPEPTAPKAAEVDDKASLGHQYLVQTLNQYITNMRPGLGVSEEQGAREQTALANILINNVFSAPSDEFGGVMKTLLAVVKDNREGAFNERYAYRFVAGMRLTNERRVLFEDLLTLTLTTSDHGVKGASKQIDVRKLIDRLADDRIVENLQSYYNVS